MPKTNPNPPGPDRADALLLFGLEVTERTQFQAKLAAAAAILDREVEVTERTQFHSDP